MEDATFALSFTEIRDRFVKLLPDKGKIMDLGCGSGRDTLYFSRKGLIVTPVDASRILCDITTKHTGIKAKRMMFEDLNEVKKYDGIWAYASVEHLPYEQLVDVLKKVHRALKEQGILYISFKYGLFEGVRNGRHCMDMNENKFERLIHRIHGLEVIEMSVTSDIRQGKQQPWMNVFLRRVD